MKSPLNITDDMMQQILASSDWTTAGVTVVTEELDADSDERVDERKAVAEEEVEVDEGIEDEEDFNAIEMLHALLDELSDDELLEHAASMLEVFDAAAEELDLLSEEEDEEEEEDPSDDINNMSPALMRAVLKAQRNEGLL